MDRLDSRTQTKLDLKNAHVKHRRVPNGLVLDVFGWFGVCVCFFLGLGPGIVFFFLNVV